MTPVIQKTLSTVLPIFLLFQQMAFQVLLRMQDGWIIHIDGDLLMHLQEQTPEWLSRY